MDLSAQFFAFFLVLGAIQQTRSFSYTKEPEDPFIVVEGVDSRRVEVEWEFLLAGVNILIITFSLEKPGEQRVIIGGKSGLNEVYKVEDNMKSKYELKDRATLVIKDVTRNEDGYKYIFSVTLVGDLGPREKTTTLKVFVPAAFTLLPESRDADIGENVTLYCNASGVPDPNITWTRDGIPSRSFNVSGTVLHLPNVQLEDVGSYRCSAYNGYGPVVSQVGLVNIKCPTRDAVRFAITLTQSWKDAFGIRGSKEYEDLKTNITSEIFAVYATNSTLCRVTLEEFRSGSVVASFELLFQEGTVNPLEPLEDEIKDGKLGPYLGVKEQLEINPTTPPTTTASENITTQVGTPAPPGKRSGLSEAAMWGIIGACIAVFLIIVVVVIIVCCCCKKKSGSKGGATKVRPEGQQPVGIHGSGMATYSEADGYRINSQYPGAGIGSPAYVEASQYAPATATRKQNDPARQPLNYAEVGFNNSSASHKPPPYNPSTEYTEVSPSKQRQSGRGGGEGAGQQGDKGFELWC